MDHSLSYNTVLTWLARCHALLVFFLSLWTFFFIEMWQSGSFNPNERRPEGDEKALGALVAEFTPDMTAFKSAPKMITILDENGEPIKAGDEDRRYFEDPWMHKFNGKYYFSYSTGTTHYLCYAEGTSPEGPFTYMSLPPATATAFLTTHLPQAHGGLFLQARRTLQYVCMCPREW